MEVQLNNILHLKVLIWVSLILSIIIDIIIA